MVTPSTGTSDGETENAIGSPQNTMEDSMAFCTGRSAFFEQEESSRSGIITRHILFMTDVKIKNGEAGESASP